jgi:hypothetical protein
MRWPFMSKKLPFLKSAVIYWLSDKIIVCPYSRTRDGISSAIDVAAVSTPYNFQDIGGKLLNMVQLCKDNMPDDYSRKPSPTDHAILREAKEKSWRAFQKKALSVHVIIEQKPERVRVSPWRRVGGGHEPIDGKTRFCNLDPNLIGETVMLTFKDAE